jgi:hypothetical protein
MSYEEKVSITFGNPVIPIRKTFKYPFLSDHNFLSWPVLDKASPTLKWLQVGHIPFPEPASAIWKISQLFN